jgi:hypothetical protein
VIEDLASHGMIFVVFVRQSLGNLSIPAPDHHEHRFKHEPFQLYSSPKNTQA